jgi:hypothetical protein
MNRSFFNLKSNIEDIRSLIKLSSSIDDLDNQRAIYRSVVVLLVASWEQFVEQLADSSIEVMTDRMRDPSTLPNKVKESIALSSIPINRNNQKEFSDSVWGFAHKGWKRAYIAYCSKLTSELHNASAFNVKDLYWRILGIRDLTCKWTYKNLSNNDCVDKLVQFIEIRHDIAHGANKMTKYLTVENIEDYINFVSGISKQTYFIILDKTAELSQPHGIEYKLSQSGLKTIINYAGENKSKMLTLTEIKKLGSSAQGNHNKLCYQPWSLLEKVDVKTRKVTDRLHMFYKDQLELPLRVLVFENGESISKPDTEMIKQSKL